MSQSIFSHTYENGLVLVAEPIDALQSAAFTLLVPVGSSVDPQDRAGLAGFTCEMALRGAGERDNRQLVQSLDNLGVERNESIGEAHSGFSGATLAANLPDALSIYADIVRRPHFPVDQLEAGRLVMFNELQSVEDEPQHKVMLELRRHHYPDPWGRPNHGEAQALEATTIDDIRRHFAKKYRPNGTILGVAGRFDWDRLKDHVGTLFGDWPTQNVSPLVEGQPGPKRTHLDSETSQTQLGIAYSSVAYRDPDYLRAWGAVGALSGGMSSRLFTEVREKRGLCYSVYASYHTLRDRGSVLCYAGTSSERAQETLDVVLAELVRLADGIEEHEIDRLKARIKSALVMQQESSSARSTSLAREWYHLGRARTLDEIGRLVDELTCASINAYLTEHPPGDFTIVTLGPQSLEVPVGVS